MTYLASPSDGNPTALVGEPRLSIAKLRRQRTDLHDLTGDAIRMLEGRRVGDIGFTGAGCRLTLAATRNALEGFLMALKDVEAEVLPTAAPVPPVPRVPRFRDGDLPIVTSVGGL